MSKKYKFNENSLVVLPRTPHNLEKYKATFQEIKDKGYTLGYFKIYEDYFTDPTNIGLDFVNFKSLLSSNSFFEEDLELYELNEVNNNYEIY